MSEHNSSRGFEIGDCVHWLEAADAIYEVAKISGGHVTISLLEYHFEKGKPYPARTRRVPFWQLKPLSMEPDGGQQNTKSSRGLKAAEHPLLSPAQLKTEPYQQEPNGSEFKCSKCSTPLLESAEPHGLVTPWESAPLSLSKSTLTHSEFSALTGPIFQSTGTSKPTIPNQESLTSIGCRSLAQAHQAPELGRDSTIQNQPCGEKPSGASVLDNPSLLLWNSLKDLSNEDFEQFVGHCEWQAIRAGISNSYRQRKSEQCTSETGSLSCPTLTSCSSKSSRPAGMTKCEKWWRDNGLIPAGYQLSASAIALLMGYPEDWFQVLSPSPTIPWAESAPDTSPVEPSHLPKPPLRFSESFTSAPSGNNYSPAVLGEMGYREQGHKIPLELKEHCGQLAPVLRETAHPLEPQPKTTPSVNNYSPGVIEDDFPLEPEQRQKQPEALGEKERTHPLELNSQPVLGDSNTDHSTYPVEPKQDIKNPRRKDNIERQVRDRLSAELGGLTEVATPAGRIDLLTETEIVEVKQVKDWKSAIGQVLAYSGFYPEHHKRVHLFGRHDATLAKATSICNELGIKVTFEEIRLSREPEARDASGWLEHYTKTKKLKNGISATYPPCRGERDPDNPEHWYWAYRYEQKHDNARSDNGYITRAVSLPRVKVEAVSLAIACGWSVEKILKFIRSKD